MNAFRGGENFIDVDDFDCGIEPGLTYVNNDRLRKIIASLYHHKASKGVIFITSTALCYIVQQYVTNFPAFLIAIHDFGITNTVQFVQKIVVSSLFLVGIPLLFVGTKIMYLIGTSLTVLGIILALYDPNRVMTTTNCHTN